MRVWIDALTPKHLLMSKVLEEFFLEDGAEVLITLREYEELKRVLNRIKPKAKTETIGAHGGGSDVEKLVQSAKRIQGLADLISSYKPSISISFGSPEAARVSFGIKVPHILICDSPHSYYVCKLTVPLSDYVLTPWVISKKKFSVYGIDGKRVLKYRSLDPTAWIYRREIWPEKNEIEKQSEGAIVLRESEYLASYISDAINFERFAKDLAKILPNEKVILLKRYVNAYFVEENLTVYGGEFFGPNVLEKAKLFVGGGGTMNVEAILFGVKTASVFPYTTDIESYLIKRKLIHKIKAPLEAKGILEKAQKPSLNLPDAGREIYSLLKGLKLTNS